MFSPPCKETLCTGMTVLEQNLQIEFISSYKCLFHAALSVFNEVRLFFLSDILPSAP